MKTKSVIIAIVALFAVSFANANTNSTKTELIAKVKQEMTYPEIAIQENLEGDVLVEFKVDEDGNLEVCQANSSNHTLKELVINKLEKISASTIGAASNELYQMKFSFKLK